MLQFNQLNRVMICAALGLSSQALSAAQADWLIGLTGPKSEHATVIEQISRRLGIEGQSVVVTPLLMPNAYRVLLADGGAVAGISDSQLRSLLQSIPGISAVGENLRLNITNITPNDSAYAAAQASYLGSQGFASLDMPQAWQLTRGSRQTVIAVLDSGILYDHPELRGRILPGYDFVSDASSSPNSPSDGLPNGSNDGDGIDADPSDPGDAPPAGVACATGQLDSSFHGTAVASVAAALSDNGAGMVGIDWNARVLPVRVSGRCGSATSSDILNAIYWALQFEDPSGNVPVNPHLPDVINLSLAAPEFLFGNSCASGDGVFFTQAFRDAAALGVPFVVSAGNVQSSAGNAGANLQFPASCSNAIAAAAALPNGGLASYSSRGKASNALTIAAPGDADGRYLVANNSGRPNGSPDPQGHNLTFFAGTSFSAPMVSGVIALMKAVQPNITQPQVIDILKRTAKPLPSTVQCSNGLFGGLTNPLFIGGAGQANPCADGIINPIDALLAVKSATQPLANVPATNTTAGNSANLNASASQGANPGASGSAALVYEWAQLAGPKVTLSGQNSEVLRVSGLGSSPVVLGLKVTDPSTGVSHAASTLLAASDGDLAQALDTGSDDAFAITSTGMVATSGSGSSNAGTAPTQAAGTSSTQAAVNNGGGGGAMEWWLSLSLLVFLQLHRTNGVYGRVRRERRG